MRPAKRVEKEVAGPTAEERLVSDALGIAEGDKDRAMLILAHSVLLQDKYTSKGLVYQGRLHGRGKSS